MYELYAQFIPYRSIKAVFPMIAVCIVNGVSNQPEPEKGIGFCDRSQGRDEQLACNGRQIALMPLFIDGRISSL